MALIDRMLGAPAHVKARISVEIRFDLRGSTAGQMRVCGRGHYLLRYNLALLQREGEGFIQRTVPHEVAHLIVHQRFGASARPHGAEWRAVMAALGADASRCHSYDVTGLNQRQLRRFAYHCQCREHQLSSIRHNRVVKGQQYLCKSCGQALRPGRIPRASAF
jgi:SprT protein